MKFIYTLILCFAAISSWGQNLNSKKAIVLKKLAQARTEQNDSIKASLYREIGYGRNYFTKDSARLLINEGLAFDEKRGVMDIHHFLLKLYSAKSNYSLIPTDSSIIVVKELLPLSEGINPRAKLYTLKDIGLNYKLLGQYDSSIYYFNLAKNVAVENNDSLNMAKVMGHIAENHTRLGNFSKAEEMLESLVETYPRAKNLTNILSTLSHCYNNNKEYKKVIALYEEQLKHNGRWELASDARGFVTFYCGALLGDHQFDKAKIELREHIQFYRKEQKMSTLNNLFQYSSNLYQNIKEYTRALSMLDSSLKYKGNASSLGFDIGQSKQRADIYTAMGNSNSASHYLTKYLALNTEKYDNEVQEKYIKSLTFYETKEKEQKIKLLKKENELGNARFWRLVYISAILATLLLAGILYYNNKSNKKAALAKQALAEAQLTSIRSQLNPHFMFNALNSIKNYIVKNDTLAASDYLTKFTQLMRGVLDLSSKPTIPLQKELDVLNLYVELEQMRFKNVFQYTQEIDQKIEPINLNVPPLFLQPFLENAIKHGLTPLEGHRPGLLPLSIFKDQNNIIFEVTDNGVGRSKEARKINHQSMGVKLSNQRINLVNSKPNSSGNIIFFDIEDAEGKPAGTKVQIKLMS